ncbi:hypothetical protein [Cryptosporangium arvum]|uniref:DUF3558 domain-containing protein n=1 Tax=Cryptosporangium arvum DSM 44712 TaxID=927661 RepID=A0A010ZXG4_9ACTN|nr:hypothetical protein [Cryptosporangium arvum]EXG81917.1 hypothetical protein CryarDRAFT_3042 [Cryptosporangium arvum DSM 44712]
MHRRFRSGLLATGVVALLGVAGCGDETPGADRPTAVAGTTAAARVTASASAPAPTGAGDRFSALPPCNEFPASLAGTFQGSVLQVVPRKKAGDTWTEGTACVAMVAAAQQPLSVETYLFRSGAEGEGSARAEAYATSEAPTGEIVTGWGDEARWSAGSCQLAVRYGNVVALFEQLSPTPACRSTIEPIARGFTALHLE